MADNPLYPGYKSKKKDGNINPLYPGYYTGKSMPRRPKGTGDIGTIDYKFDDFFEYINSIDSDVANAPKWIKDRIVDDFKGELKAIIKPKGVKASELDEYNPDSLPGASGVSVSLDPEDWKDPKKQIKKTVGNWAKAVVGGDILAGDLKDLQKRVNKDIYSKALGLTNSAKGRAKKAKEAVVEGIVYRHGTPQQKATLLSPTTRGINPIDLGSVGIRDKKGKDLFRDAGAKYVDLQDNIDFAKFRESKYEDFLTSAGKATSKELERILTKAEAYNANPANTGNPLDINAIKNAKEHFDLRLKISDDIESLDKSIGKGALKTLKGSLVGDVDNVKLIAGWDKFVDDVNKKRTAYTQTVTNLQGMLTSGKITQATYDQTIKDLGEYSRFLDKTQSLINSVDRNALIGANGPLGGLNKGTYIRTTVGRLSSLASGGVADKSFANKNGFRDSIKSSFLRGTMERNFLLTSNPTKDIGKEQIGNVLMGSEMEKIQRTLGIDVHSTKFKPLMRASLVDTQRWKMNEILEAATKGNLGEVVVWNGIIKPAIDTFTPAFALENALSKNNYFNLVIDDDNVKKRQEASALFKAFHTYKYSVDFDVAKDAKLLSDVTQIGVSGAAIATAQGLGTLKFAGSTDLKFFENFNDFVNFDLKKDQEWIRKLMEYRNRTGNTRPAKVSELVDIFGLNRANLAKLKRTNPGQYKYIVGKINYLSKLEENYNKWLKANQAALGITNISDPQFKYLVFYMLKRENGNPDTLAVYKKYIGHLDRVFVGLNKLQTKVTNSYVYRKLITPLLQLRTEIASKLSAALSKAIAKLLGTGATAATGGLTAALQPIIEWVITKIIEPLMQFIVNKTVDYAQVFMKGLLQGDIGALIRQLDKETQNLVKTVLKILAIGMVIPLILIILFEGITSISISPIDPITSTNGYNLGTENMLGENACVKVEKNVTVTIGSKTITNPSRLENSDLSKGVTASYEIVITPKVNLPAGSVTYSDNAYKAGTSRSSTTLFSINQKSIGEFIAGQPIVIEDLPDIRISTSDTDTMFANVVTVLLPEGSPCGTNNVVGASRSFGIGKALSLTPGCETYIMGILPKVNANANTIAKKAYEIASSLERGFWCYFNKSSIYPELWNSNRWNAEGVNTTYKGANSEGPNDLFWCTWLIIKAYQAADPNFPAYTGVTMLKSFFANDSSAGNYSGTSLPIGSDKYIYKPRANTSISEINVGDVIFYSRSDGGSHVGIVYSKTSDSITTIESNAVTLTVTIPTDANGYVTTNVPGGSGLQVDGFGSIR